MCSRRRGMGAFMSRYVFEGFRLCFIGSCLLCTMIFFMMLTPLSFCTVCLRKFGLLLRWYVCAIAATGACRLCGGILSSRVFTWGKMSLPVIARPSLCCLSSGMSSIIFVTTSPPSKRDVSVRRALFCVLRRMLNLWSSHPFLTQVVSSPVSSECTNDSCRRHHHQYPYTGYVPS